MIEDFVRERKKDVLLSADTFITLHKKERKKETRNFQEAATVSLLTADFTPMLNPRSLQLDSGLETSVAPVLLLKEM